MNKQKVSLWQLFWTFFKTGAFTFGGGLAMISILEEQLVAQKKWMTSQEMLDMIVIAESTPGVIAVNSATHVGYKLRGIVGALLATLGVVLPSFLLMIGLYFVVDAFQGNVWYNAFFSGIQCCVVALIANAFVKMSKLVQWNALSIAMFAISFVVSTATNFNVIFLILIGALVGIVATFVQGKKQQLPIDNALDQKQGGAQ